MILYPTFMQFNRDYWSIWARIILLQAIANNYLTLVGLSLEVASLFICEAQDTLPECDFMLSLILPRIWQIIVDEILMFCLYETSF
jgi:hypothetical protein